MEQKKIKKLSSDAAILSIVGYLTLFIGLGVFLLLVAFIFHIIVTVEYKKKKKEFNQTTYVLLIVGFFVPILDIVALFMVANKGDKNTQNIENRDNIKEVYRLKQLLDDGLITQEEFENKKKTLLI